MPRVSILSLLSLVLEGWAACAQQPTSGPSFDAVSLKPIQYVDAQKRPRRDPTRIYDPWAFMLSFIKEAYGVPSYVIDGPDWMRSTFYEMQAAIPAGARPEDIPLMFQAMLSERFGLVAHHEKRLEPTYALVLKRELSSKIVPSKDSQPPLMTVSSFGRIEHKSTTMAEFAVEVSNLLAKTVVDETGLRGRYDFVFEVNPSEFHVSIPNEGDLPPRIAHLPLVPGALSDLGLKLDERKGLVDHIVIDHLNKIPTEN